MLTPLERELLEALVAIYEDYRFTSESPEQGEVSIPKAKRAIQHAEQKERE